MSVPDVIQARGLPEIQTFWRKLPGAWRKKQREQQSCCCFSSQFWTSWHDFLKYSVLFFPPHLLWLSVMKLTNQRSIISVTPIVTPTMLAFFLIQTHPLHNCLYNKNISNSAESMHNISFQNNAIFAETKALFHFPSHISSDYFHINIIHFPAKPTNLTLKKKKVQNEDSCITPSAQIRGRTWTCSQISLLLLFSLLFLLRGQLLCNSHKVLSHDPSVWLRVAAFISSNSRCLQTRCPRVNQLPGASWSTETEAFWELGWPNTLIENWCRGEHLPDEYSEQPGQGQV